jgi:hypothetical protein
MHTALLSNSDRQQIVHGSQKTYAVSEISERFTAPNQPCSTACDIPGSVQTECEVLDIECSACESSAVLILLTIVDSQRYVDQHDSIKNNFGGHKSASSVGHCIQMCELC